jgi:hypothetical protein
LENVELGVQTLSDIFEARLRSALRNWDTFTRRRRIEQSTMLMALQRPPDGHISNSSFALAGAERDGVLDAALEQAPPPAVPLTDPGVPALGGALHRHNPEPMFGSSFSDRDPARPVAAHAGAVEACAVLASIGVTQTAAEPIVPVDLRAHVGAVEAGEMFASIGGSQTVAPVVAEDVAQNLSRGIERIEQAHPSANMPSSPSVFRQATFQDTQNNPSVSRVGYLRQEVNQHIPVEVNRAEEQKALIAALRDSNYATSASPRSVATPREASSLASRQLLRELSKDQQRVDEVIRLADILWGSGLLSVNTRRPPLLKSSLLVRLVERCYRTKMKDAMQLWWRHAAVKSSLEALNPQRVTAKSSSKGHGGATSSGLVLGDATCESGLHLGAIYQDPIAAVGSTSRAIACDVSDERSRQSNASASPVAADDSADLRAQLAQAQSAEAEARATADSLLQKLQAAEAAAEAAQRAEAEARAEMEAARGGARDTDVNPRSVDREVVEPAPVAIRSSAGVEDLAPEDLAPEQALQESESSQDENDYLKLKAQTSKNAAAVIQDAAADTRPAKTSISDGNTKAIGSAAEGIDNAAKKDGKVGDPSWDSFVDALAEDSDGHKAAVATGDDSSGEEDMDSEGIADLLPH